MIERMSICHPRIFDRLCFRLIECLLNIFFFSINNITHFHRSQIEQRFWIEDLRTEYDDTCHPHNHLTRSKVLHLVINCTYAFLILMISIQVEFYVLGIKRWHHELKIAPIINLYFLPLLNRNFYLLFIHCVSKKFLFLYFRFVARYGVKLLMM